MVILGLGLSYLGTLLWYAASPRTAPLREDVPGDRIGPTGLRLGGTALLLLGGGGLAAVLGSGPGLLIALATGMGAASVLVIAGPLWPRFPELSALATLLLTAILPWIL